MTAFKHSNAKVQRTANYIQITMGAMSFLVGMSNIAYCLFAGRAISDVAYVLVAAGLYVATGFDVSTWIAGKKTPK